jgi:hypothetical protein
MNQNINYLSIALQSLNLTLSFSIVLTPNLNPDFKTVGFLGPNRRIFGVGVLFYF